MVRLGSLTSLAVCWTQVAFWGAAEATKPSDLKDIVPRREVLYVGGKYTNISVRVHISPPVN